MVFSSSKYTPGLEVGSDLLLHSTSPPLFLSHRSHFISLSPSVALPRSSSLCFIITPRARLSRPQSFLTRPPLLCDRARTHADVSRYMRAVRTHTHLQLLSMAALFLLLGCAELSRRAQSQVELMNSVSMTSREKRRRQRLEVILLYLPVASDPLQLSDSSFLHPE